MYRQSRFYLVIGFILSGLLFFLPCYSLAQMLTPDSGADGASGLHIDPQGSRSMSIEHDIFKEKQKNQASEKRVRDRIPAAEAPKINCKERSDSSYCKVLCAEGKNPDYCPEKVGGK